MDTHLNNRELLKTTAGDNVLDSEESRTKYVRKFEEVSQEIRALGCEIMMNYAAIPKRWGLSWFLVKMRVIRTEKQITEAVTGFIYISNNMFFPTDKESKKNYEVADKIRKNLGLKNL